MRDIIFRGKRVDNGKWTEGYLFKIWNKVFLLWGMTGDSPNMEEVVPETVGQFTGLCDKNGRKIFEGDILEVWENEKHKQSVVVLFEKGRFIVSHYALNLLCGRNLHSEVIGNIYDNTEE